MLHLAPALAIMVNLILAAFGAWGLPVAAADPEPAGRLEIVVNQIYVIDDRDGAFAGVGEMHMDAWMYRCIGDMPCRDQLEASKWTKLDGIADVVFLNQTAFSASLGETKNLGYVFPTTVAAVSHGVDIAPKGCYLLRFKIDEHDDKNFNLDDDMGAVVQEIDFVEHGPGIGPHEGRAWGADGGHVGDYIVTYDVRPAPVADLFPGYLKVEPVAGSNKSHVCISVVNSGQAASGSMYVELDVDGVMPLGGRVDAATLGAHENGLSCVDVVLPTSGQHTLTAVVDADATVQEVRGDSAGCARGNAEPPGVE